MTDHDKLREAGLEFIGRLDDVITPGKLSRFLPGDLICRPLPPPEPTVDECEAALWLVMNVDYWVGRLLR